MDKAVIAYIPVIHHGVIKFLHKYRDRVVMILANDVLDSLSVGDQGILSLQRDPRIIQDKEMLELTKVIHGHNQFAVRILKLQNVEYLNEVDEIVMPDEDVTRLFAQRFLKDFEGKIIFDQTFLRWGMSKTLSKTPPNCDQHITYGDLCDIGLDIFVDGAFDQAKKSSDWWRQVGAVMVKEKQVVLSAFNHHMPTEYQPYMCGDPRSNFDAGNHIELSTAGHAEATIIAEAAKRGISTKGADIFVTTFPCCPCAILIAQAGFRRLFFVEGYSNVNSVDILKDREVEIIHVQK